MPRKKKSENSLSDLPVKVKKNDVPESLDAIKLDDLVDLKSEEKYDALLEEKPSVVEGLSLGLILKKARENRGVKLEPIAEKLCIRPAYLKAFEQEDFDTLPEPVYAVGFLRTYAKFLDLNADNLVDMYRQKIVKNTVEPMVMPMPERQNLLPSLRYFILPLFGILIVWVLWYFFSFKKTDEPALPPIVTSETPMEPIGVPLETMVPLVPTPTDSNEKLPVEVSVDSSEPLKVLPKVNEIVENKTKKMTGHIQIVAKEDVWIEIVEDDTLILSRVLKSGEVYDVPSTSENMLLKTGNAGGMDILVDGRVVKGFGPVGAVRSNISLSAEKLKNR